MNTLKSMWPDFQELISLATGITKSRVILADQGQSAPSGNALWATYKPVPIRTYGFPRRNRELVPATYPTTIPNWKDYNETLQYHLEVMLSVNIYNDGASDAAWRAFHADLLGDIPEFLYKKGIGWRYASDIRNLTALQQASYQERYQFDLHLFIDGDVSANILTVAAFNIKIENEDGTIISEINDEL